MTDSTRGRPSSYTPEIGHKICAKMMDGKSLRKICDEEGMPVRSTVFDWLLKHEDFSNQYARAQNIQLKLMTDDILDIADSANHVDCQARRLQVDSRKWYLSKVAPKAPRLKGTFCEQVYQISEAVDKGNISSERAEMELKTVMTKAALAPIDEYQDKLAKVEALAEKLTAIKDAKTS